MTEKTHRNALPAGYRLHWYTIEKTLGQGGFGMTYLARDDNLNQSVAIKEYLPRELAVRERDDSVQPLSDDQGEQFRWGLDRFLAEARTLAQFRHPHIVRVLAVFEANRTAYMVMEYERGQGLHEVLAGRRRLPEAELRRLLLPLLDGLEQVHAAGFIHRDIKPANIYIREDGSPVLLDFGSARQALGEATRTLTSLVSPGYAPFEQYVAKSDKQGPWTDIYGLGATLYRAVTGLSPPEAVDRSEALLHTGADSYTGCVVLAGSDYSPALCAAIDHALAFKPQDRPQSIAVWRRELDGNTAEALTVVAGTGSAPVTALPAVAAVAAKIEPPPLRRHSRARLVIYGTLALAFTVLLLAGLPANKSFLEPSPPSLPPLPAVDYAGVPATEPAVAEPATPPPMDVTRTPAPVPEPAPVQAPAATAAPTAAEKPVSPPSEKAGKPATTREALLDKLRDPKTQKRIVERLAQKSREAAKDGDIDAAVRFLDQALILAPENRKLLDARERLARLRPDDRR
jgi:serine/threonine protein kinase